MLLLCVLSLSSPVLSFTRLSLSLDALQDGLMRNVSVCVCIYVYMYVQIHGIPVHLFCAKKAHLNYTWALATGQMGTRPFLSLTSCVSCVHARPHHSVRYDHCVLINVSRYCSLFIILYTLTRLLSSSSSSPSLFHAPQRSYVTFTLTVLCPAATRRLDFRVDTHISL